MNFSFVRNVYLDWHLRVLGYKDPCPKNNIWLASPPPRPRVVTCQHALQALQRLPDLEDLKALQSRQERARPMEGVERRLKLFCLCAGPLLIEAFETLARLRGTLDSLGPRAAETTFSLHQYLVESLVDVRKCHAIWELSAGDEAFFKKHPRPRAVRFEYLRYMLQLLYVVASLTFPEDLNDYLEEMERVLGRQDWRDQLVLDSEVTYARTKRKLRPEVIAPVRRYPTEYLLHGQTSLRPLLIYNTSVYGHRLIANECAIHHSKAAASVYLNLGRFNTWDQPW